jgi:lysozyme
MAVVGCNAVIDLYYKDTVTDWDKVKSDGIVGVLHKATEGLGFTDKTYFDRKEAAKSRGLLWGSYHYSSGADPIAQVKYYLDFAKPEADEVMCIDCEPSTQPKKKGSPRVPDMTFAQLEAYVKEIKAQTGRLPMVYGGGNFLSGIMEGHAGSVVNQCPLWFAEYPKDPATEPQIALPDGWQTWKLWQYAADGYGPLPHNVAGIGRCDRDTFNGKLADLKSQWPFTRVAAPV